jgi:dephospho-CoA kinase
MRIIVLTGGLGAGKSTASRFFASRGAHVIDVDVLARDALAPGSPTVADVIAAFGAERVCDQRGHLDREALARIAFSTPAETARLNAIVHPAVTKSLAEAITRLEDAVDPPQVVAVEVPLLAEVPKVADIADEVLAIEAPVEARVERAGRRGIEEDDARRRIALQACDDARAALAGEIIVNDGSEEVFLGRLSEYWLRVIERDVPA